MLSIAKCRNEDYHIELTTRDYYLEGGEPLGQWYGKGANHLGLWGDVEKDVFKQLWHGFDPEGRKLVRNAGRTDPYLNKEGEIVGYPQRAWDLTFSAPKSVSILWGRDPDRRYAIQEAHDRAVRKALDYLEREAGFSRKGQGGEIKARADLTFSIFQHGSSREEEIQLHSHAI